MSEGYRMNTGDTEIKRDKSLQTVDLKTAPPDSQYDHDLFDEYGNVIIEARTPLSPALIRHLLKDRTEYLYYYRGKDAPAPGELLKPVVDETLQEELKSTIEETLREAREAFDYANGNGISRDKVLKTRRLVDRILQDIMANPTGRFNPFVKFSELDEYDYTHSTNVSILAALVACKLEFSTEIRSAMGLGALFHDIGKTSVSKAILGKMGKLDEAEFDEIKNHTHLGYKFVEKNPHLHDLEKRIVLLHHERPDGNGYPFGVEYEHYQRQIPREVRLISLCDIYSSLISDRPYGKAMESRRILRLMLNMVWAPYKKFSHLLPVDFRDFIRAIGVSVLRDNFFMGPGDLVRIDSGEICMIEEMNKLYPLNPVVLMLTDRNKTPLKRKVQVDMLNNFSGYIANVFDREKTAEAE